MYRSSSAAWWCLAVGVGALTVASLAALALSLTTIALAANLIVGSLIAGLVGTLIGVNIGNRKRYLEAVIDRSHQLWVEREQHAQLAASAERARIAREMHDIVSHSLTVVVALSEGASATSDRERARAATAQISSTAREALREMRAMLGVLREDDADVPLHALDDNAVASTIERAQRAGFPVVFHQRGPLAHPRPVRLAIARIVQEGITNAMRHAPGATRIDVIVDTDDDVATVEVRNNGAIAPVGSDGFGIRGLHERIEHVGGTLEIGPHAPDIWLLTARLPLDTTAEPRDEYAHAATKDATA